MKGIKMVEIQHIDIQHKVVVSDNIDGQEETAIFEFFIDEFGHVSKSDLMTVGVINSIWEDGLKILGKRYKGFRIDRRFSITQRDLNEELGFIYNPDTSAKDTGVFMYSINDYPVLEFEYKFEGDGILIIGDVRGDPTRLKYVIPNKTIYELNKDSTSELSQHIPVSLVSESDMKKVGFVKYNDERLIKY